MVVIPHHFPYPILSEKKYVYTVTKGAKYSVRTNKINQLKLIIPVLHPEKGTEH